MPFGDVGQGTHALPQAMMLVASTQIPPHAFLPAGQPSQTASIGTHLSMHGFCPAGQVTPHFRPSQVAVPPAMPGQGSHATAQ